MMRQCKKKKGHTNKISRLKIQEQNIDPEEINSKHTNQVDHKKNLQINPIHLNYYHIVEWKIQYIQNQSNLL